MPELLIKAIGEIDVNFLIPDYQRGYRWEIANVDQLLDDLYQFALDKNSGNTYFLQPVVVKKRDENKYELIDGQQRMTSLFLLGKILARNEEDPLRLNYDLEYQTSNELSTYLKEITNPESNMTEDIYKSNPNKFYMYQAYKAMNYWFDNKKSPGSIKAKIRALLQPDNEEDDTQKLAKIIWYETDSNNPENEFRKLNDYAIKLTNGELIKALILRFKKSNDEDENKQQIMTSAQWDTIEKQFSDPAFFGFLTNESINNYDTKIDLLFELHFNKRHNSYNKYATLQEVANELQNGKTEIELWSDIYHSFEILSSWYNNKDMYHKIGYLVSTSGKQSVLPELLQNSRSENHSIFESRLDEHIKVKVKDFDFDGASFGEESIKNILVLYNTLLILENENNKNFFPFYLLKNKKWEIEHIQPRSDGEFKNSNELLGEWVKNNVEEGDKELSQYKEFDKRNTYSNFRKLYEAIVTKYSEENADWLNGIGNLCLLEKGNNIAVSNYLFKTKRQMIMDFDKRGDFIPLGTKNCFMRYFEESEEQNIIFWTSNDRKAYVNDIQKVLARYLDEQIDQMKGEVDG